MAKVLSSISGNLISAASAGYAPTNSADVSAIASAYQVVSATGTQLYAGTAHVTSINSTPISASRAGNAANASMANSAYYDGTGRLISSLPDSATVSAIASSYADGKADASALSSYALSADVSGVIDTVSNNSASWKSGGVVTATGSSWIDGSIGITTINESSLSAARAARADKDGLGNTINSYYAAYTSLTGVSSTVANNSASWGQGVSVSSPSGTIFVSGDKIEGTNSAVLTASSDPGFTTSFAAGVQIPSWTAQELYAGTLQGSGATLYIPSNGLWGSTAIISGRDSTMAIVTASGLASEDPIAIYLGAIVSQISASANNYISITGDVTADKKGGIAVTGIGELAWASSVSGVVNTVSSNSATWGQGGVDSATVSAIASSYAESAASSKLDTTAFNSGDFYTTANESGFITGVDLSPYQTTADMSAYIPTSMSSDFQPVTGMSSYVPYSSLEYNTASAISGINGSALAGTTYSAGTGIDITDDVISVEAPVDIVAGPGIVIDNPDGNTLRVSVAQADETVLWDGEGTGATSATLSESILNFETIKIVYAGAERHGGSLVVEFVPNSNISNYGIELTDWFTNSAGSFLVCSMGFYTVSVDGKTLTGTQIKHMWFTIPNMTYSGTGTSGVKLFKIIGCNRIASN